MKTNLDCIPCLLRQALESARLATKDETIHEAILRDALALCTRMEFALPPPVIARKIHQRLKELTGDRDPYRDIKARFNHMAIEILPELADQVAGADDPLAMAVRLAIAGNVIDLGATTGLTETEVRNSIDNVLSEPFAGDMAGFRAAVDKAAHILYLADNAGEIVLDRLLIEQLHGKRITLAVRGRPIINDATVSDARVAGIHELCAVVDNGTDVPGTVLDACSRKFRDLFGKADLIISKGQGNYETLSDLGGGRAGIFFLLKVKCPVIAAHIGLDMGTHVLMES